MQLHQSLYQSSEYKLRTAHYTKKILFVQGAVLLVTLFINRCVLTRLFASWHYCISTSIELTRLFSRRHCSRTGKRECACAWSCSEREQ